MKHLILLFLMLPVVINASPGFQGWVGVNDTLNFPVICLDTLGRDAVPESAHVFVWYHGEGANDSTYTARNGAAGASGDWLDSINVYGFTEYNFIDLVADIDNGKGNGNYSGDILTWKDGVKTHNRFSFKIIGDATAAKDQSKDVIDAIMTGELQATLDSIQNQDDWAVAKGDSSAFGRAAWDNDVIAEASRTTNVTQISGDASVADSIEKAFDGTSTTLFLSRLSVVNDNGDAAVFVQSNNTTGAVVIDNDNATTGAGMYIHATGSAAGHGLSVVSTGASGLYANGVNGVQSVGSSLDFNVTLDLDNVTGSYDNADFETAYYEVIADSVLKDSSSYQGATSGLTASEVADSIFSRDVSTYATDDSSFGYGSNYTLWFNATDDSVNTKGGIVDSVRSTKNVEGDNYTPDVNVVQISGDAAAADSLEKAFDGTATTLFLNRLQIINDNGDAGIFVQSNNTTGAVVLDNDNATTGAGVYIHATGVGAGHALSLVSTGASGLYASGVNGVQSVGSSLDFNVTLDLDNVTGSYDNADFETAYYEVIADTVLKDSLSYQGAGADSAIVDGALNARIPDIAKAASDSTLKDSLSYQGEPCEGNGEYLVILKVFDESDNALSSTFLTVTNGSDAIFYPVTNANGIDTLWLNSGDWYVYAYNSTYLQNSIPQTVAVSAAMTDTIEMTSQAAGSGFVRLWARAYDYQNGAAIEGATLTIQPTMYGWMNTSTGGTYLPKLMTATTDSTGIAAIIVPRTSSVTVSGADSLKYDATFSYFGYFDLKADDFIGRDSLNQLIIWDISSAGD